MSNDLVSIIMLSHDRGKYVRETVESVGESKTCPPSPPPSIPSEIVSMASSSGLNMSAVQTLREELPQV